MSKLEPITPSEAHETGFAGSYERLLVVDSVVTLVAGFLDANQKNAIHPSVTMPQKHAMEAAYHNSIHASRVRFDRHCDELARIARAGAQALIHLKSEGRMNLHVAAQKLIAEIDRIKRESLTALKL